MTSITAVIVIYNKSISQSKTCNRVLEYGDVDILVVDNSTKDYSNQQYCEKNSIPYISMGGNKGLSKAYNIAVERLKNTTDVIVLMDDDTEVPRGYFDILKASLHLYQEIDIFAPIIRGQDGVIYSPNNYNFLKNQLVQLPIEEVKQESFNAISSCLAIRMKVFNDYRFNENLFVDEIDHCFFREQRKKGRTFGILNIEINQNFHQREMYIHPEDAWNRIRIRIIDIFRHARLMGGGKYRFLSFIKCCGLGVQIGKKSHSIGTIFKAGVLSISLVFRDR